jgi:hypothetical protein
MCNVTRVTLNVQTKEGGAIAPPSFVCHEYCFYTFIS